MPDTNTEELAIIRRMEELLATPDRWCQKTYGNGDAMCIVGACRVAMGSGSPYEIAPQSSGEIEDGVLKAIVPFETPHVWNDKRSRTHKQVLAALARARRRLEAARKEETNNVGD